MKTLTVALIACALSGHAVAQEALEPLPAPSAAIDPNAASVFAPSEIRLAQPEAICPGGGQLTIEFLEQVALANNPSIAQAAARIQALRGRQLQVGLPPNPTAGYLGSEIGNEGHGGQQGGFAGQEFVTGNKLALNQAVVAQEIQIAEQRLRATELRVRTDVRKVCYRALIAQRKLELAQQLLRLSTQAVDASQQLLKAEEIPQAGLLQAEVEQQNAHILLQTADNELQAAWRGMSALLGQEMPVQSLAGDLGQLPAALSWDEQLIRVTADSPEIAAAMTQIVQARASLRRAVVEPIPNLSTQVSVQYDDNSNSTIVGAQVGIPLPLWNRNQGGVRQAQGELLEAERNAQRVELELKSRLANAYQTYASARNRAEIYVSSVLPKSKQTIELVQRGYQLGEVGYLDYLTAQRTFSQTNLAYLDSVETLWMSWAEIDGLLLTGGLDAPK